MTRQSPAAFAFSVAVSFLAAALAGCIAPSTGGSPQSNAQLESWQAAATAHGSMGVASTLNLAGGFAIHGDGNASFSAPFALLAAPLFSHEERVVFFREATVAGMGQGDVAFEGATIRAISGSVTQLALGCLTWNGTLFVTGDGAKPPSSSLLALPKGWSDEANDSLFAQTTSAEINATFEGYDRGVFESASGSESLRGPITIHATSIAWAANSGIKPETAHLALSSFALDGANITGSVNPEFRPPIANPQAIYGSGFTADVTASGIASDGMFRLTQALTTEGYQIPAQVELDPASSNVAVAHGNSTWLAIVYREAGYEGDAVLANVSTSGPGAVLVTVPLARPPGAVAQVMRDLRAAGPLGGLGAFALFPAALADFFEGVGCVISLCPQNYPYPVWMAAGDAGTFYLAVKGDAPPGAYPVIVTWVGQNFPAVSLSLNVTILAPGSSSASSASAP
ncbi:MAG: hypothetical protein ACYDDF_11620 [Thermoplasmatota archaeon]